MEAASLPLAPHLFAPPAYARATPPASADAVPAALDAAQPALSTEQNGVQAYASHPLSTPALQFPDLPRAELPSLLFQPEPLLTASDYSAMNHVDQYGDASSNPALTERQARREAQANCGPSSASIVMNRMQIPHGDLHTLRTQVDAPLGTERHGAYAITADQLVEMVKTNAAQQLRQVDAEVIPLNRDAEVAYDQIRTALSEGKQVVLRTGNMESNGRGGHYVVVTHASEPPDRNLTISDPQYEDGAEHIEPFSDFEKALKQRRRIGMPSDIMTFKENYPEPTILKTRVVP